MNTSSHTAVMNDLIEPVARCLTPDVALRILNLRASPELQATIDDLADRCQEGTLSAEEQQRYEQYVRGLNFIGVLQAKARKQISGGNVP